MMLNHSYVDLRNAEIADVAETIAFERRFVIESANLAYDSPEMEDWLAETALAMELPVDMGVCSAVEALSAVGATPISSCNGGAFTSGHASDVAHVLFSCRPGLVRKVTEAARLTNCGVINNGRHAEVYATEVEHLIDFAEALVRSEAR